MEADWLRGDGEVASAMRAIDWSATALGPMASWPASLRTALNLLLELPLPASVVWGPGHTQFYNDEYRKLIRRHHPAALGVDYRAKWAAFFGVIGAAYDAAWAGTATRLEDVRVFLDLGDFQQERWASLAYSPIADDTGAIAGVFHVIVDQTRTALPARRARTLAALAGHAVRSHTTSDAYATAMRVLGEAALDLPFVLLYLVDDDAGQACIVGQTGWPLDTATRPLMVELDRGDDDGWGVAEVVRTGVATTFSIAGRLAGVAVGPYPEAPSTAMALPIAQPGGERPAAVLVVGLSARLTVDDDYRTFCEQVAAAVSTAVVNARAHEEAEARAAALAELDRAKTTFFSNVSHELRTPLTLILAPIEDARRHGVALVGERLELVHRSTVRLLRLVNDLLDFARLEAGHLESTFEPTDLALMTAGLAEAFRSLIEPAGLTLAVECPPLGEPVHVDRAHWEKIVTNLVANAFKFTLSGGIAVRLRAGGGNVELRVADTGVGIPAHELGRLFERFHRIESTRGRTIEGTGLGLSLVHALVEQHGGEVTVSSELGAGTTFIVTIPLGAGHLPPERVRGVRGGEAAPGERAAVLAGSVRTRRITPPPRPRHPVVREDGGARILIADDNDDMRDYLVSVLAPLWDVEAVGDGRIALVRALADPPDLVLSDVMMPELDGFGLVRALRADPRTSAVPLMLLSARAGEESVIDALEEGASDYLVKPFSSRELVSRVRTHLETARLRREREDELVRARDAAETANRELETFSYSVAHDLRAPLRGIDGFAQALSEDYGDSIDEDGRRYLRIVRESAQRMGTLIDDLLHLSRVTRTEVVRQRVDLSALARAAVAGLERAEPARRVEVAIAPGLYADADPRLLALVFDNLLGNAWKFTRRRADARVELGSMAGDDGRTIYFVRDNGAGFDEAYADKLFGVFQRLHSLAEFEGTGVGLATVQRIMHRHRGRVWAAGKVGEGATFYFTLDDGSR